MKQLQFPTYSFRFKNSENKVAIFDEIRKKFIIITPEEWVRQHVVQFLLQDKKYPKSHINVEKLLKIIFPNSYLLTLSLPTILKIPL